MLDCRTPECDCGLDSDFMWPGNLSTGWKHPSASAGTALGVSFALFLSLGIGIACLLDLARFLRIATDNLDLVCSEFLAAVAFESHVLNQKCPDVIAESVGLEMALS